MNQFPGTIQARAEYDENQMPKLLITEKEAVRLRALLKEKLKREPDMRDLFDYVWEAQKQ